MRSWSDVRPASGISRRTILARFATLLPFLVVLTHWTTGLLMLSYQSITIGLVIEHRPVVTLSLPPGICASIRQTVFGG